MMRIVSIFVISTFAASGCGEVSGVDVDADQGNPAEAPTVSSLSPERGSVDGGTEVTITGTGFTDDTRVIFGNAAALSVTVDSETQLTVVAPGGPAEDATVDVLVFNQNGLGEMPAAFTFNFRPIVSSIQPRFGNIAGGATITLNGSGFMVNNPGTPAITIGGEAATSVTVVDDETITFDVPASAASEVAVPKDVVLESSNGTATLEGGFHYTRPGLLFSRNGRTNGFVNNPLDRFGIYYVDPGTGRSFKVADTIAGVKRLTRDGAGTIWATTSSQTFDQHLGRLDPVTGDFTSVSEEGVTFSGTDTNGNPFNITNARTKGLAFVTDTLYVLTRFTSTSTCCNSQLGSIDTTTGEVTTIGTDNWSGTASCITRQGSGALWMAQSFDATLDTINLATGARTAGPTLTPAETGHRCHGMAELAGTLYAIRIDSSRQAQLISINTTTGLVTEIGKLPQYAAGLAQTPAGF